MAEQDIVTSLTHLMANLLHSIHTDQVLTINDINITIQSSVAEVMGLLLEITARIRAYASSYDSLQHTFHNALQDKISIILAKDDLITCLRAVIRSQEQQLHSALSHQSR